MRDGQDEYRRGAVHSTETHTVGEKKKERDEQSKHGVTAWKNEEKTEKPVSRGHHRLKVEDNAYFLKLFLSLHEKFCIPVYLKKCKTSNLM